MLFGWLLIFLGLVVFYLIIDFLLIMSGNFNNFIDKWVGKTLWLWLPFYGLWRLTKEVILKKK